MSFAFLLSEFLFEPCDDVTRGEGINLGALSASRRNGCGFTGVLLHCSSRGLFLLRTKAGEPGIILKQVWIAGVSILYFAFIKFIANNGILQMSSQNSIKGVLLVEHGWEDSVIMTSDMLIQWIKLRICI